MSTRTGLAMGAALLVLGGFCAFFACHVLPPFSGLRMDPALWAADPTAFRNDAWDRRAAAIIDASRGTNLAELLSRAENDEKVVAELYATRSRSGAAETLAQAFPSVASDVLLLRRPRATYALATEAMAAPDPTARAWGLLTFELIEGRLRGGAASAPPGPPYRGPERDEALAAVVRLFTSDPVAEVRHQAIGLVHDTLPDHDEPSVEAIVASLRREEDAEVRPWLLWLLREREAPPAVILDAAMRGFHDPVTVSVGIYDLLVEENRALLEKAFREGDVGGRAGIGETFYRNQSAMPWAETLILQGLSDPELAVRAHFAKGAIVLKPLSPQARARLEAMADDVPNAAWALSVLDRPAEEEDGGNGAR